MAVLVPFGSDGDEDVIEHRIGTAEQANRGKDNVSLYHM